MKHVLIASAIAVVALVVAATAVAVAPSGGATYAGKTTGHKSSKPIPVKLKVAPDGESLTFSITCMGATCALKGIKLNAQGGFSKNGKVQGAAHGVGQVLERHEGVGQIRHAYLLCGQAELHRHQVEPIDPETSGESRTPVSEERPAKAREPTPGLEPGTPSLRVKCSTS
jgi:hypothetical protein